MKTSTIALLLVLGAASACKTTSSEATPVAASTDTTAAAGQVSAEEQGRELTSRFYAGDIAPIWALMDDRMRTGLESEAKLAAFQKQVEDQVGAETKVLDEQVTDSPPYQVYLRTASFSKVEQPVTVQWAFDADGRIAGFFVRPAQ